MTRRHFPRLTEAALKRSVVKSLKLALGTRGRVLRMNAGRVVIPAEGTHKRRVIGGVEPGTPDLLVLLENGRCVFLELKGPRGRLEQSQVLWHARARALGHTVVVARTVGEAMAPVLEALDKPGQPGQPEDLALGS